MTNPNGINKLLTKVDKVVREKKLDLSSDEDLSIGIMNLISIEEHLFFTSQKTGKEEYLNLLDEVRSLRRDLMKLLIKDYEGEVWCIEKHLLAASMRIIEVGTKYLSQGKKSEAQDLFSKAYKLYSLFWGINLGVVKVNEIKREDSDVRFINDDGEKSVSVSLLDKLGQILKKAIDCCRE